MKNTVKIDQYTWNERELAQIIRRKMTTKSCKNKKKYSRTASKRGFRKETSLYFFFKFFSKKIEILLQNFYNINVINLNTS